MIISNYSAKFRESWSQILGRGLCVLQSTVTLLLLCFFACLCWGTQITHPKDSIICMSYTLQTNVTFPFSKGFFISYSHVIIQINPQRMALYMRGYTIAKGSSFGGSTLLITRCSFRQQGYWNDRKKNCETNWEWEYFTLKWRGCYLYDTVLQMNVILAWNIFWWYVQLLV